MTLQFLTILSAAGGMAMLALTHNAAPEYFMFSALTAVILVSYASSRLSARALRVRRTCSDRVFENDPLRVQLEVTNGGRFPRFLVDVNEALPQFMEADEERDFMIPTLWPGESVVLTYTARARKRGVYTWSPVDASASDPFGIFQRFVPVEAQGDAVVYPKPLDLNGSLAQSGMELRGMSTGERTRGSESGLDFYGIRDYTPGDDLRRIHWPTTARHGKLTVIEFDRGASGNVAVVLDTMAGTEFGAGVESSLEVGVRAAASIIHLALASEGVGFLAVAPADGPLWVAVEQLHREYEVLEVLARVKADGAMPASAVLQWAASHLDLNANVVLITAAPDGALPSVVGGLRRRQLHLSTIVLDAHSFDLSAPHPTHAMSELEAAGADVIGIARGADLQEALARVIAGYA